MQLRRRQQVCSMDDSQRVKMEAVSAGHMSDTQACAHAHTCRHVCAAGRERRRWGEGERERRVPSPPAHTLFLRLSVSPSTSLKWVCASRGCAISHPLHSLTWSGGMRVCVCGGRCCSSCTLWRLGASLGEKCMCDSLTDSF